MCYKFYNSANLKKLNIVVIKDNVKIIFKIDLYNINYTSQN